MEAPESLHGSARVHDRAGPEDALSATAARYWWQMAAGRIARTWKSACHSAFAGRSTKGYGHRPDSGSARKEPPLDARGRMSPRHRQAGNEIQKTGQSRKPGNKKARRCWQHTSKVRPLGGELGVWRAASAGARRKRWRREGDSNPRRAINPYTLSRRAT